MQPKFKTVSIPMAIWLDTTPRKILSADDSLAGLTVQNNETVANIKLRPGSDGHAKSYMNLKPDGNYDENLLPPNDEIWGFTDAGGGAYLTVWKRYRVAV